MALESGDTGGKEKCAGVRSALNVVGHVFCSILIYLSYHMFLQLNWH